MNCPVCKKPMKAVRNDESINPANNTKYERTVYNCEADDTWANTELPKV